jgi:serine/threonine-protein kinase
MGSVFEAEHTGTGRRVALKMINVRDITSNELLVSRFHREAKAAGAVDTQHITQVLDTGTDSSTGMPYMVMEFLAGEDLQNTFKRLGPIAPDLALRLVAQACLGLQKAHEGRVVHRDIKPANLFLAHRDAGERIVKLLDFGIAKMKLEHANDIEGAGLTRTGNMLGSPLYMSPEQARGAKDVDHRTDIWSLGAVLYQALTGRTPYEHHTTLVTLLVGITSEAPPPVQDFAPWVSSEIAAIVHGALKHDLNERFQSAAAMFQAIRSLLPNGWTVHEEMLAPLSPEMRTRTASRTQTAGPTGGVGGGTIALSSAGQSVAPAPVVDSTGSGSWSPSRPPSLEPDPRATASAMAKSHVLPPPSGSKAPVAVLAGLFTVVAALGGAGFYFTTRSAPPSAPASTEAAMVAPQPEPPRTPPPAVPTTAPVAAALAAPADSPLPLRRVKVVVIPSDALVEVEGKLVPNSKGIFEITGALGSIHRVRVYRGKSEIRTEVIVTDAGPSPPRIDLQMPASTAASPAPTPPPATPTPPADSPPPGIKPEWEN